MKYLAFVLFLMACVGPAHADELNPRPVGTNCSLTSPPADAGESSVHDLTIHIYPRAKDIGPDYTGCQIVFAVIDGQQHMMRVEVIEGDPRRHWSEENSDKESTCRYQKGRVIQGNPRKCSSPDNLFFESMAPGCAKKIRDSVEKYGRVIRPKECEYE